MSFLAIVVLGIMALAALTLCYQGWFVLPREMDDTYKQSLAAFARAIEARSNGLCGSTEQAVLLSVAIARDIGLSKRETRRLEFAVYLRDIGLSAVAYSIINNPGRLTAAQRSSFDRHAETGASMLDQIPHLRELAPIVRFHHAVWDGEGSLPVAKGDRLPIQSRVLAVVSRYCEQVGTVGHNDAIGAVRAGAGTLYDPSVVASFSRVVESANEPNYWESLRRSVAIL